MIDDAIQIQAVGVSLTTGAASVNATIPNTASATKPKYIRLCVTANCFVKIGQVGVVATGNDILMNPADCLILKVSGNTTIAAIQQAAGGICNITALEDL